MLIVQAEWTETNQTVFAAQSVLHHAKTAAVLEYR